MRAFLAIELPLDIRHGLLELQRQLGQARADVKWVEQDNIHVTMRFLGEISEDQRQAIEKILDKIASHTSPLGLSLSHVGAFPSVLTPRVIWVGVGQGNEALERIASELEDGLASLGLPREERKFTAHVTLGRVRSSKNREQLASQLKTLIWKPPESFWVDHLTFFQSTLTGSGPIYTPLAKPTFSAPPCTPNV